MADRTSDKTMVRPLLLRIKLRKSNKTGTEWLVDIEEIAEERQLRKKRPINRCKPGWLKTL